jgi:hypothetical protein
MVEGGGLYKGGWVWKTQYMLLYLWMGSASILIFFLKKKHHTGLKKTINQLLVEDLEEKKIITNA